MASNGKLRSTSPTQAADVFARSGILSKLCLAVILLFILAALLAPLLTPYAPTEQSLPDALQGPTAAHLLGTDNLGRDLLTRLLFGARISLLTSLLSSLLAAAAGMALGLLAGYFEGFVSQVIMRVTDAHLSIPPLILTMVLAFAFGGGAMGVSIVIGISMIPTYVRMIYGMVLSLKKEDYVTAARLVGLGNGTILARHLLPNCFPSLIVLFTMNLGTAIMLESTLSYLGVGITAPTPAWGSMVAEGYRYLLANPALAILPGLCVLLVVIAFNVVGDTLRDVLDPRLRGKL